jgi:hypothetical protein
MKYILLLSFLIAVSCKQPKKVIKTQENSKTESINKEEIVSIKDVKENLNIKTQEDLIVVLKNPNKVLDAKALIENSSLVWQELVIDDNSLKAVLIKVPFDKKDFWLERLKTSNVFSSVEVNTENTIASIKHIAENMYVKISKTHCSGDCPVYDVVLFKDGKVLFNGIENVLVKGKQEFKISTKKMKKIKEMFQKTSFGTYLDNYADRSVMDFPSTFITHNNKQIEIKLWKKVPLELALASESIEDILLENKMIK